MPEISKEPEVIRNWQILEKIDELKRAEGHNLCPKCCADRDVLKECLHENYSQNYFIAWNTVNNCPDCFQWYKHGFEV
jgi:hypothetical protein